MSPETIHDLDAFAVAAEAALDASTPAAREPEIDASTPAAREPEIDAAAGLEIAGAAASPAHEIVLAHVLDLPSAAELDRWLASPWRRAA